MESLDKILSAWDKDSQVDILEPGKELVNIPKLHKKYLDALVHHRLKAKKSRTDYAEMKKTCWTYYNGNYNTDKDMLAKLGREPFKLLLKSNIDIYMDSDPELIKINDRTFYHDECVKACESIMGELKSRTFQIRDLIIWEKFVAGA